MSSPPPKKSDADRNRCKACGFKWYPAGVDRATACPRCGSEEIEFSWTERWPAYVGCAAVGAFLIAVAVSAVKIGTAYYGSR